MTRTRRRERRLPSGSRMGARMPARGIQHVDLCVSDVERSLGAAARQRERSADLGHPVRAESADPLYEERLGHEREAVQAEHTHSSGIPSSGPRPTSAGIPRTVLVAGTARSLVSTEIASCRVKTR